MCRKGAVSRGDAVCGPAEVGEACAGLGQFAEHVQPTMANAIRSRTTGWASCRVEVVVGGREVERNQRLVGEPFEGRAGAGPVSASSQSAHSHVNLLSSHAY